MSKPRILLALFNETATQGIFDSKAIGSLASYAKLDLLHASPIDVASKYFNNIYVWPRYAYRERAWLALYQLHLLPFTRTYYPERLGDQNLWQGFRAYVKVLLPLFDNWLCRAAVVSLLRRYLDRTNPLLSILDGTYDAIVCITGIKDPMYEDLVRFGRAKTVPVFAITQNWDNINYKPIVERPDLLGVWGMQGYYVARLVHGFTHAQLVPVGSARMEVYFDALPEPCAARPYFGLPQQKTILLFAGAGPQFEEASLIRRLDDAISSGQLPDDVLILYKPHPRRAPRPQERPLDFSCLKHVRLVPPSGPGSVSICELPALLRAVDGVVSPYSTLLLEAALCGRPCLAIAYDDPAHNAIKWETVRTYIHLTPLSFAPWALACTDKEALVVDARRLVELTKHRDLGRRAREDALHILFHDGRDFGTRVADAVASLMAVGECR